MVRQASSSGPSAADDPAHSLGCRLQEAVLQERLTPILRAGGIAIAARTQTRTNLRLVCRDEMQRGATRNRIWLDLPGSRTRHSRLLRLKKHCSNVVFPSFWLTGTSACWDTDIARRVWVRSGWVRSERRARVGLEIACEGSSVSRRRRAVSDCEIRKKGATE